MADIYIYLVLLLSIVIMCKSIMQLFAITRIPFPVFSWSHFCVLLFIYLTFIVGFSLIYLGLSLLGYSVVLLHGDFFKASFFKHLGNMLYFSTMTMLTVGYGEITPIGIGKFIASIQALVGYLLPTAFFISGIITLQQRKIYAETINDHPAIRQKRKLK